MRYTDLINEDPSADAHDYQQMMALVNANKAPGVPPDQQVAFAMYKELQRQQALSKSLSAELQAAEKRIDQATQSSELAGQERGKHQAELERERERGEKQKDAVNKIDQEHSAREQASAQQLQQLASQLETIKSKPGVSAEAGQALEKQIEELKTKGVDPAKYDSLAQSVARMQNMQQVDEKTMQDLMAQVNDAKAKADELVKTRAAVGGEIEQTSAQMQDEIDQLKQQLAHFKDVEKTVSTLTPMVQDVIAPKVDKLYKRQLAADNLDPSDIAQKFAAKGGLGPAAQQMLDKTPAPQQLDLPGVPAANPKQMNLPLPTATKAAQPPAPNYSADRIARDATNKAKRTDPAAVYEDKLFKLIKWATGK